MDYIACKDCGNGADNTLTCEECELVGCCDVTNVYCRNLDANLCAECANLHRIACRECGRE
jgi:hypothetical protein